MLNSTLLQVVGTEVIEVGNDVAMMMVINNNCFHLLISSPSDNVFCILPDVPLCEEIITILFLQRRKQKASIVVFWNSVLS